MNPTLLISASVVVLLAVTLLALRSWSRYTRGRSVDLGAVSPRWISELRRDEPFGSS